MAIERIWYVVPMHTERTAIKEYDIYIYTHEYHDIPIHTEIAINSAYEYAMVLVCL